MASGSAAFNTRGGYNQSGGANYIVVTSLTSAIVYDVPVGAGSGGASTFPAPIANSTSPLTKQWGAGLSSVTVAGSILKDMGKTYISSQRTFRKFQAVSNAASGAAAFGVTGPAPNGTNGTTTGYFTFYLETSREAQDGASTRPAIARYM
jgi:hypothetical protein